MACCTTIAPLNSGQKRSSGGLFDLPRSAKRRRPFNNNTSLATICSPSTLAHSTSNASSSSLKNSNSLQTNGSGSTMYTTASSFQSLNKSVVIDANAEKNSSVFQTTISYSPLTSINGIEANNNATLTSSATNHQEQFRNDLMERIRYEAKRLIRRRQMSIATSKATTTPTKITTTSISTQNLDATNSNLIIKKQGLNISPPSSPNSVSVDVSSSESSSSLPSSPSIRSPLSSSNLRIDDASETSKLSLSNRKMTSSCIDKPSLSKLISSDLKQAAQLSSSPSSKLLLLNEHLNHNDLPIFSMNQVNTICERMLREREQFIREEYDKILAQKLYEQYDAFVKFTHEQIQRRFESSQCSYVS